MNIKEIESNRDTLHVKVTIPSREIDSDVITGMTKLAKNVKINGFRVGRVPISLLEKKHSKYLRDEAVRNRILEVTSLLIKERNLRILMEPIVEYIKDEQGKDLEFSIKYYLWPEISISNLENILLEKPILKLDQSDIDKLIKKFYLKTEAKEEDQVTIDVVKKDVESKNVTDSNNDEINDVFAKQLNYDNLQQLREQVEKDLYQSYKDPIKAIMKIGLFKELDSILKFNIPDILIDKEVKVLAKEVAQENNEELKAKLLQNESYLFKLALRRIKIRLVLMEYARIYHVEINQEDIKSAIISQAKKISRKEKEISDFYLSNPRALEALRGNLLEDKILTVILEKTVKTTEKFYSKEELEELVAKSFDSL